MNYQNIANEIKNYLLQNNFFKKVYVFKPIPRDVNELNKLGETNEGYFEVCFINRDGVDVVFTGIGAKSGEFKQLKGEKRERFVLSIFRNIKDENAFINFQNKIDALVDDISFRTFADIWTLDSLSCDVTEFYGLGDLICHRADMRLNFVKQI